MKLILEDFEYKGCRIKRYEVEWPKVKTIDDIPEEKVMEYIKESLDDFLEEEL